MSSCTWFRVKKPVSRRYSSVCRSTEGGRLIKASSGGLAPRCTTELTSARLAWPLPLTVPTRLALLKPDRQFMNAARCRSGRCAISSDCNNMTGLLCDAAVSPRSRHERVENTSAGVDDAGDQVQGIADIGGDQQSAFAASDASGAAKAITEPERRHRQYAHYRDLAIEHFRCAGQRRNAAGNAHHRQRVEQV